MRPITIATRGSKLALWQAHHIRDTLMSLHPGLEVELSIIKTQGDKILDVPLARIGGKGLFVKEIEDAMLSGAADLAVHSFKDVPAEQPEGLVLGPSPKREDPADMMLSARFADLDSLPKGASVGTSSLRRKAQLLMKRPDLDVKMLRGNLDTRVRKAVEGEFDAVVVAAAGLNRLGLTAPKAFRLGPPDFLPAVAQGALCLEHRAGDEYVAGLVAPLRHADTCDTVAAERGFLITLEGGCQVPMAAYAVIEGDSVRVSGMVCDTEGERVLREELTGPRGKAFDLGVRLAKNLIARGADEILAELNEQALR